MCDYQFCCEVCCTIQVSTSLNNSKNSPLLILLPFHMWSLDKKGSTTLCYSWLLYFYAILSGIESLLGGKRLIYIMGPISISKPLMYPFQDIHVRGLSDTYKVSPAQRQSATWQLTHRHEHFQVFLTFNFGQFLAPTFHTLSG